VSNPFVYRPPTDEQIETMQLISDKLGDLYEYIQVAVPRSAERTLAVRKLQEARMWLNAGLVLAPDPDLVSP
jgi:hypothetical protein